MRWALTALGPERVGRGPRWAFNALGPECTGRNTAGDSEMWANEPGRSAGMATTIGRYLITRYAGITACAGEACGAGPGFVVTHQPEVTSAIAKGPSV